MLMKQAKVEPQRELWHPKRTKVPVARTVAERPVALKSFSQSGRFDWVHLGPQVNFQTLPHLVVPILSE